MKKALCLLPLIAITACSTPLQQCVSNANRQVATLDHLINVTQTNIQRGFGVVEVQDVQVRRRFCTDRLEDGSRIRYRCDEVRTFDRDEPVAIDIAQEQVKLAQLQERRAQVARAANARTQQCLATYPQT